jgi:hypothetical protein
MGRKSVASRTARETARRRSKYSINEIYRKKILSRYPECVGLMLDCPSLIDNPKTPPEKCNKCPHFMDSGFYCKPDSDERVREISALFQEFRKK